jgi:hypothetical protein
VSVINGGAGRTHCWPRSRGSGVRQWREEGWHQQRALGLRGVVTGGGASKEWWWERGSSVRRSGHGGGERRGTRYNGV